MTTYNISGTLRLPDTTTTQGNVLAVNAAGNLAAVTTGTVTQVLTSGGAGTEPTFADALGLGGGSTGIVAKTAATTYATRTITAGNGISITNGDGVAGNPTISCTGITMRGFMANKTGTQSATNNTWTTVTGWSTAAGFSVGGDFVTATGIFTAPFTGYYQVTGRAVWALTNQNVVRMAACRQLNGTPVNRLASSQPVDATTSLVVSIENVFSGVVLAGAGDTFGLAVNCQTAASTLNATDAVNAGSPSTTGIGTYFGIYFIAPFV